MRYESTVPAASEPSARPAQMDGSSPASQVILVAVKYGSSRSPVSSVTLASCPASRSHCTAAPVTKTDPSAA